MCVSYEHAHTHTQRMPDAFGECVPPSAGNGRQWVGHHQKMWTVYLRTVRFTETCVRLSVVRWSRAGMGNICCTHTHTHKLYARLVFGGTTGRRGVTARVVLITLAFECTLAHTRSHTHTVCHSYTKNGCSYIMPNAPSDFSLFNIDIIFCAPAAAEVNGLRITGYIFLRPRHTHTHTRFGACKPRAR